MSYYQVERGSPPRRPPTTTPLALLARAYGPGFARARYGGCGPRALRSASRARVLPHGAQRGAAYKGGLRPRGAHHAPHADRPPHDGRSPAITSTGGFRSVNWGGAAARVPRPTRGRTRAACSRSLRSLRPSGSAGLLGLAFVPRRRLCRRPRFLPTPRPALARFAALACCVRFGAARPLSAPRCASPRSHARPLPAPSLCCGLGGRSLLPTACGLGFASLRASYSVALAVLCRRPCAARQPAGVRLRPLRGKGRARSGPAPLGGPCGPLLRWAGAGPFLVLAGPARLRCASVVVLWWAVGSPLPPPARPPPLGAPGGARLVPSGFAPRCMGRASRAPLAGPPRAARAAPVRRSPHG